MNDPFGKIPPRSLILVAVSGGADSVFLVHHLRETLVPAGHRLVVGHVNHRTRGEASDLDEQFVRELAERLEIPCHVERVAPESVTVDRQQPGEATLRQLRLSLLKGLARRLGASVIAFGHQRDDLAETFLLNSLRGSGPTGLEGLRPARELPDGLVLLRPLLQMRKTDIEAHLRHLGETWRVDESNFQTVYRRNMIRHEILPALEKIDSAAVTNIANSAEFCGEMVAVYWQAVEAASSRVIPAKSRHAVLFSLEALRNELSSGLAFGMIRHAFLHLLDGLGIDVEQPVHPTRDQVRAILARVARDEGEESEFRLAESIIFVATNTFGLMYADGDYETRALEVHSGFPFLLLPSGQSSQWQTEQFFGGTPVTYIDAWRHSFEVFPQERQFPPNEYHTVVDEYRGFFDAGNLRGDLSLRVLDPNERFELPGGHTKRVRDCLQEAAVPPRVRRLVAGLCDDEGILWIPGVRRSARAWINGDTSQVLEIRVVGRQAEN